MAVVYFTSNASTGAGSLAEAIQNAQPGDVVRPDETVFERGATIEIALASTLTIDKNLTLDASPFRVAVDGGSVVRCAFVASGATASFASFDFVGGASSSSGGGIYVDASATLVLARCRVAGCSVESGGGGIYSQGVVALNDCVVTGCVARSENGGGISATGALVLDGSTVVGNSTGASGADAYATATLAASNSILGDVSVGSATVPDYRGCVVDVALSSVGFVASPPSNLTVETWDANAWENWDLRLLDDASGAPSPYRDSGDVGAMSRYDLDGNFRGRETNDVATCSPGAYETLQADLFWIGEPFPQTLIDLAPQNITVSNFTETATAGRATVLVSWTIPENASYSALIWEYKTNTNPVYSAMTLSGTLENRLSGVVIGRIFTVRIRGKFANGDYTAWSYVEFTADASINDATGGDQTTGTMLPSALSVVNPSFLTSDGWATSRFATSFGDTAPQAGQTLFIGVSAEFSDAAPENATIVVGATSVVVPTLNGAVVVGVSRGVAFSGVAHELKLGAFAQLTTRGTTTLPFVEFADVGTTVDVVPTSVYDGIFFAAAETPANVTFSENGGWADTRANVTAIDVDPTSGTTVAIKIVKSDATVAAFAQYSDDDETTWRTVETTADVDEYELTVAQGADVTVRVATATGWLSDTVSTAPFLPVWTVSNAFERVTGVVNAFEVATGGSNTGNNSYNLSGWGNL